MVSGSEVHSNPGASQKPKGCSPFLVTYKSGLSTRNSSYRRFLRLRGVCFLDASTMRGLGGRARMEGFNPQQFRRFFYLCLIGGILILLHHVSGGISYRSHTHPEKIPQKIWQSWKVDSLRFEDRDTERARTWTTKNSGYRYEVLTDDNAMGYVEQHFGPSGFNRPDIVHIYRLLNAKIIRSDLLRYLVMYVEGGVYADIDVEAIRPITSFIPKRFDEREVDMVIGIEVDEPTFNDHPILGPKSQSFCQWTFMCKPGLPVMMRLIENILKWLSDLSQKQGKPVSELTLDFDEVISGTGPSAFTKAILAEMSKATGELMTWESFHDLTEAKLVSGVLVLTVEAFAAGTGHSDSGNHGGKGVLVKHHFHASSWPTNHPRFKHPIYGEIEKCNWDVECVKLWDANTAFFNALPEEEQFKIIAIKEIDELRDQDATPVDPAPVEIPLLLPNDAPAAGPREVAPAELRP